MADVTQVWSGFHTLTGDECRRLLLQNHIGRLAATSGALPCVLPVQYSVVGRDLVLRTPGHHEVSDGIDGQVVGFETDQLDIDHGMGWCVSVTGTVRVLRGPAPVHAAHRWFSDGTLLAMSTDLVTGHRVAL